GGTGTGAAGGGCGHGRSSARGRSVVYALYDRHVADLLDHALHHVEHLRLGLMDPPGDAPGA
ncbi:hypothetical protein FNQ90_22985, partial [Streptomyces alkaliphilus]|nr:hypothetical protein [Streptomyces alkaliphilus]